SAAARQLLRDLPAEPLFQNLPRRLARSESGHPPLHEALEDIFIVRGDFVPGGLDPQLPVAVFQAIHFPLHRGFSGRQLEAGRLRASFTTGAPRLRTILWM